MESAEKKLRGLPGYDENARVARTLHQPTRRPSSASLAPVPNDIFLVQSPRIEQAIMHAQQCIWELSEDDVPLSIVAREIRTLLCELVGFHTGTRSLEIGLEPFLDALWEQGGFADLVRQLALNTDPRSTAPFVGAQSLSQDLLELIGWYQRRIASLRESEAQGEIGQLADRVFGMRVGHDRRVGGAFGMEVSCGVRCVGRAGQPLWLKVFVAHDEGYVAPAQGWEHWADSSERGTVREVRFAAATSLSHPWQRFMADRVELFIPYDALKLAPGRTDLQLEVVLFDQWGAPLASAYRDELICVVDPRRWSAASKPLQNQPVALGVWPTEFVHGDSIRRFDVCRREDSGARIGCHAIEAWYDIDLVGQRHAPMTVEFCLLHSDGSVVEDLRDRTPKIVRHIIHSVSAITRIREQGIGLSLQSADVALDEELFAELTILSDRGRLICGTTAPVTDALNQRSGSVASAQSGFGITVVDRGVAASLRTIEVNPDELFNQHRFVQTVTTINLPTSGIDPWQVVVKILDENGVLLGHQDVAFVRSLWVGARVDQQNPSIIINFDQEQLLLKARNRSERRIKLECQVQIFSSAAILVSQGSCPFALAVPQDLSPGSAPIPHQGAPVWIEGVAFASSESGALVSRIALNFLPSSPENELVRLYYDIIDGHGQSLRPVQFEDGSPVEKSLPGRILTIKPNNALPHSTMPRRWHQVSVELSLELDELINVGRDKFLKLMLFSAHGQLEHVVRQPLPLNGLLSSAVANVEGSAERLDDPGRETTNSKKRRGFFAWR